jgi:hypothetical protein
MLPLYLLFICFSAFGSQFEVPSENVLVSHKLGDVKLYHTYEGFKVQAGDECHTVQKAWIDPMLRKMNAKQLQAFLGKGYISINKLDNNEYSLKAKVRGLGGGLGGATAGAVIGGSAVQFSYGVATYAVGATAALVAGPAVATGVVAVWTLFTFAPAAVATKVAMIGGGIAGGVMTGPI